MYVCVVELGGKSVFPGTYRYIFTKPGYFFSTEISLIPRYC